MKIVLAYDLVKIRFIKEKEVILNGNTNDKSRGIQLIGPGYLQKVIKGVNLLLSLIKGHQTDQKYNKITLKQNLKSEKYLILVILFQHDDW